MHRFRWVWLCFVFKKKKKKESCWFHMHQHLECTCARCKVTLCKKETPIYCMSEVHYSNSGCAGSFCQHSINRPRFWATQRAKASAVLWCWNQQCHQSRWSETEHTTVRIHSRRHCNHSRLKDMRLFHKPLTRRYLRGLTDQSSPATHKESCADGIPPAYCGNVTATVNIGKNFNLGVCFGKKKTTTTR